MKRISFIGGNTFLCYGIIHVVKKLHIYLPEKFSEIVIIDLSSYRLNMEEMVLDNDKTLVIILIENEKDEKIFQLFKNFYRSIYLVTNCTLSKLYGDLKDALINIARLSSNSFNKKYNLLFTHQESLVIGLILKNQSIASISSILNIPKKYVYNRRASIMKKINANNVVTMYIKIQQIRSVNHLLRSQLATNKNHDYFM